MNLHPIVEHQLSVGELLDRLAQSPCACGKRKCGDRQELVGDPEISENPCDPEMKKMRCSLRCTVCGDVHPATTLVHVPREIEEAAR